MCRKDRFRLEVSEIMSQQENHLVEKALLYSCYPQDESFSIHMLTSSERSFLTNAYLIETENALVAVDSFMIVSDAMALRDLALKICKPLISIIITHGHPDHYNGNSVLLEAFPGIPVISTQGITDCIRDSVDAKEVKWKPYFAEDWPAQKVLPNQMVTDGSTLILDGLLYHFRDLGAAESTSDMYFTLGKKHSVVFVGDVVFNRVHGFMNDGHSARWLTVLRELTQELAQVGQLFTGHGQPDQPSALISAQIDYINAYRSQVVALLEGTAQLSVEQKIKLEEAMTRLFPDYQLSAFIQAGADSVATELQGELSSA